MMAPALKAGIPERERGFESHPLRNLDRWQSGRLHTLGKRELPQGGRGFESLPIREEKMED